MDPMAESLALFSITAESTTKHASRSSKRTDDIHLALIDLIHRTNPLLECLNEHKLNIATGTFDVDICVRLRSTGKIVACISLKASISNIAQNRTNNENVKLGEAIKIRSSIPSTAKLMFFDILPASCPYYKKDGSVKNIEKRDNAASRVKSEALVRMANTVCANLIDGIYTIVANYTYNENKSITFESISDIGDMSGFLSMVSQLGSD